MLMPCVGQGAEHLVGHAGLPGHAQPDHRDLGHVLVAIDFLGPDDLHGFIHRLERGPQFVARNGERDVRLAVFPDVLHDHVHGDVPARDPREEFQTAARHVRHAQHGHAGLVLHQRGPADRGFRRLRLGHDHRPGTSLKLLRTWIGTLNFLANSIERLCITPAPRLASSSISS